MREQKLKTTLGETTITTYNNANGHIFYDIADKDIVDAYFASTGIAWFYGIDEENERVFYQEITGLCKLQQIQAKSVNILKRAT